LYIKFNAVNPVRDGFIKGRPGIFRRLGHGAAMGDNQRFQMKKRLPG
jgi:hypothetical protein